LQRVRTLSRRLGVIQEEERARIARELHDQLGVELTCLKIDLSRLNSLLGNGKPAGRRRSDEKPARRKVDQKVRSMTEQIDAIIQTVQRIVRELRPGMLDDLGLAAAIEWLAEDFQRRTGIACTCQIGKDELRVDPGRATVVFRICQEALTNVARHARATAVAVRVEERHNGLVLEVQDNGCGIPAGKLSSPHSLGLLGMRERADLFGGEVSVSGHRGKGTTVVLHLPAT
jgi:signal transduction histidine kinase